MLFNLNSTELHLLYQLVSLQHSFCAFFPFISILLLNYSLDSDRQHTQLTSRLSFVSKPLLICSYRCIPLLSHESILPYFLIMILANDIVANSNHSQTKKIECMTCTLTLGIGLITGTINCEFCDLGRNRNI